MARKNFRVNVRTPRLLALFWRSIQSGKIPGPPPPRLLPDLPFELLGQIASFLHNDTPSLLAFASVCLTWRAASRHIRFHQITLDARRQGEHPLEKLQVLLKSDPSLGSLIRVVRAWFVIEGQSFTSFYEPWFSQLPIVLHNNLQRVHTLEIRGLGEFGELPAGNFFSELSYVASIEHLSLVHCCLRHQQLNDFITSLPNLKSLHVHNHWLATRPFNWSEFDPHNIPLPSHFPPLTTFNYHNDNASGPTSLAFLHWLSPIRTLRSVGIHIDSGDAGSILEISEFLANLGGSLEHLELRFLDKVPKLSWALNRGDDDIRACLDLNNNPNLRVLHLHPLDHPSIPFISLQVAHRIQKFIFTDAEYVIEAWDDMNNSKLDTLLASDTFKVLERVYLIRRGRASKVLTHTVSRVFPTLSTRGLLDLVESKGNLDCYPVEQLVQ